MNASSEFENTPTKRIVSPELEKILYEILPVLDHGFVRVVDYMGTDESVVQAARISYGRGTKVRREDQGLINYLMRHQHTTPFEMCEIKLHLRLPFFVARQWIRHRTANVNEYSARYSILSQDYYMPEAEQICPQPEHARQGRSDEQMASELQQEALRIFDDHSQQSYRYYQELLNLNQADNDNQSDGSESNPGVSRELARMVLPLNFYTEMYWKIDLHNLLHFLALRSDPGAQYEIRVYAEKILEIVEKWVPMVYAAFVQYRKGSVRVSANAWEYLRTKLDTVELKREDTEIAPGEWRELMTALKR